jgi:hypothetical protein
LNSVGLPYFLLSTTGPLVQSWFATRFPGRSPFRLYALSNIGSLLALVSYPFLVEPYFRLGDQAAAWSAVYVGFVVLCGWNAVCAFRERLPAVTFVGFGGAAAVAPPPSHGAKLLWLLLAATASIMLLATTNQMCQEVAVTPLLWIVPLAIYLVSFILTFDAPRWYRRDVFGPLLAVSALAAWYVVDNGPAVRLDVQLIVYCATLFVTCMICHGELARAKPEPSQLTLFYLLISVGGACGGLLTAYVAPWLFRGYWEYQIGLGGTCLLLLACLDRDRRSPFYRLQPLWAWAVMGCATLAFCSALGKQALGSDEAQFAAARNFYGVLKVVRRNDPQAGPQVAMIHGRVVHGVQCLDAAKRDRPTSYYGPTSGIGVAMTRHPHRLASDGNRSLRVGIIGLGAGTMAAYLRPADSVRYYEINPDVVRLARDYFTFLSDAKGESDIVLGDARIVLERELQSGRPQHFDILAIDAFSGDAIPMHLLTRECFDLYRAHLADDGLLVLHVSNDHVDLTPVIRGLTQELGWQLRAVNSVDNPAAATQRSDWLIATANRRFLGDPQTSANFRPLALTKPAIIWTDDFCSLRQVMKE